MTPPRKRSSKGRPPGIRPNETAQRLVSQALLHVKALPGIPSMRIIAGLLQVDPMTIYHHYGDKDGFYRALALAAFQQSMAQIKAGQDPVERLYFAYAQCLLQYPCLFSLFVKHPGVQSSIQQRFREIASELKKQKRAQCLLDAAESGLLIDFIHGHIYAILDSRSLTRASNGVQESIRYLLHLFRQSSHQPRLDRM